MLREKQRCQVKDDLRPGGGNYPVHALRAAVMDMKGKPVGMFLQQTMARASGNDMHIPAVGQQPSGKI